jgi:hypothetical protein
LIESDEYNVTKIKLDDTYKYNLLNYVYCKGEDIEYREPKSKKKECDKHNITYYINLLINIFAPVDDCDIESHLNIYGGNKLFNAVMKIIYLILLILMMGTVCYIIISIFLGGLRGYTIIGKNIFSYFYGNGKVYIYILILTIIYCFAHSIFFKYMFIDNIYAKIYSIYTEVLKVDSYVNGELKAIESEKDFINILSKSTLDNIDIEYELNVHNKKIIDNIKNSTDINIKASKIFAYAIYIYFKRQNIDDIDIMNKLNSIILQEEDNKGTLRGLLTKNLNGREITSELNNIVAVICSSLAESDFEGFDFNNLSSYVEINLNYKVAYKINKFFDILVNTNDNIDFVGPIYYLNIYLVLEWLFNLIYILLLFVVLYYNSEKDPFFKAIIDYIKYLILIVLNEFKTGLIGI